MDVSENAKRFTESVIRAMTRLAMEHGAVNLAQGFPDFDAAEPLKKAAMNAIAQGVNQYAITFGAPSLRQAMAEHYGKRGYPFNPDTQATVTCGATEAMMTAMLALVNPGDEVVVFEPFYENYGPSSILAGAAPRYVTLYPPSDLEGTWTFKPDELAGAFSDKTRAVIVNTPNNPSGKVFTLEELSLIAELAEKHDAWIITDEIYEYILYDGRTHLRPANVPGARDRTVTISGASKTFSVTGWRLGWIIASEQATGALRKVHDFLTVGAPAPLQQAAGEALLYNDVFFQEITRSYENKRSVLYQGLRKLGLKAYLPEGAYYILVDVTDRTDDDTAYAQWLTREAKVATVPGSSFFATPQDRRYIRFAFPKTEPVLEQALENLGRVNL